MRTGWVLPGGWGVPGCPPVVAVAVQQGLGVGVHAALPARDVAVLLLVQRQEERRALDGVQRNLVLPVAEEPGSRLSPGHPAGGHGGDAQSHPVPLGPPAHRPTRPTAPGSGTRSQGGTGVVGMPIALGGPRSSPGVHEGAGLVMPPEHPNPTSQPTLQIPPPRVTPGSPCCSIPGSPESAAPQHPAHPFSESPAPLYLHPSTPASQHPRNPNTHPQNPQHPQQPCTPAPPASQHPQHPSPVSPASPVLPACPVPPHNQRNSSVPST